MAETTPQERRKMMNRRQWILRVSSGIVGAAAITGVALSMPEPTPRAVPADFDDDGEVEYPRGQKLHCVSCDRCMPCRFGVAIPSVFEFYNRAIDEGFLPDMTLEPDSPELLQQARTFLRRYDAAIGDKHQAHRCIKCWHCANACPNRIFIVKEMERITAMTERLRDIVCAYD